MYGQKDMNLKSVASINFIFLHEDCGQPVRQFAVSLLQYRSKIDFMFMKYSQMIKQILLIRP